MTQLPKKSLNILLVEDTQAHIDSALEQLAGHKVTVKSSLADIGFSYLFGEAQYDAVLTDGFVPGYDRTRNTEFHGPGIMLASIAQQVPYVGLLSAESHHSERGEGLLSLVDGFGYSNIRFGKLNESGNSTITTLDGEQRVERIRGLTEIGSSRVGLFISDNARDYLTRNNDTDVKRWDRVLETLTRDYTSGGYVRGTQ